MPPPKQAKPNPLPTILIHTSGACQPSLTTDSTHLCWAWLAVRKVTDTGEWQALYPDHS